LYNEVNCTEPSLQQGFSGFKVLYWALIFS
jgi:hypothetical protein